MYSIFLKLTKHTVTVFNHHQKKKHQIIFAIKHAFRVVLWEILLYFDRHGQEKSEALQHLNAQCAKLHCLNHQKEVVLPPTSLHLKTDP